MSLVPSDLSAGAGRAASTNLWKHWAGREATGSSLAEPLARYLAREDTWFARRHGTGAGLRVGYFSAEFAVSPDLPVYAGGLGVLAGDHLKSASDLGVPLVAVGLLYREGYFMQRLDAQGRQRDEYRRVEPAALPIVAERRPDGEPLTVELPFLDRRLYAAVWRADVGRVPLYLLDTDVPANRAEDRRITDRLYGGDIEHRLRQEIVLGIGGMRALAAVGKSPTVVHLNEGHAAFAAVERVRQAVGGRVGVFQQAAQRLSDGVLFTTHTPVPAGHDIFAPDLLERYIGGYIWEMREPWQRFLALGRLDPENGAEPFNMTVLALRLAGFANGVSRLHGQVSRRMWRAAWPDLDGQDTPIGHVTNGVHVATWVAPPIARLYDEHVGAGWSDESDPFHWHRAAHIPLSDLWSARREQRAALVELARDRLVEQVARRGGDARWARTALDADVLTIVFARRFATYKRAALLLNDVARLERLLARRDVQFIFAGKAHPHDLPGQDVLHRIARFAERPAVRDRFVFLEGYDVELAAALVAGADVWLNVPRRPREASGTSGMKTVLNGIPNLSIPDGWWMEGYNGANGWAIGDNREFDNEHAQDENDAASLYHLLEDEIVPLFYNRDRDDIPRGWVEVMRETMRSNIPKFCMRRMIKEYTTELYIPAMK